MKQIKLKKLKLINFKGIRSFEVEFSDKTDVYGSNATGKTTIFDAFLWLLFGKDSNGRTEFEIKHIGINGNGNGSQKQAEVEGIIEVDGTQIVLKRTFKEKWQRKRGASNVEFTGHETVYHVNEVPCSQKEYNSKIDEICPEHLFKLITNPFYFSSLKWQVQREILFELAGGEIPDEDIAKGNQQFEELLDNITGKSLTEYKKQVAATKKKIKDELQVIPARIDELNRSKPAEENWNELEEELNATDKAIKDLDAKIEDRSRVTNEELENRESLLKQIHELKRKQEEIKNDAKSRQNKKLQENKHLRERLQSDIEACRQNFQNNQQRAKSLKDKIKNISEELEKLRNTWYEKQQERLVFDQKEFICPTCKRPLDSADIEAKKAEMQAAFNENKTAKLNQISQKGKQLNLELKNSKKEHGDIISLLEKMENKYHQLKRELANTPVIKEEEISLSDVPGYTEIEKEIKKLQAEYDKPIPESDTESLRKEKAMLSEKMRELSHTLALREQIKITNSRINELEQRQEKLGQEMADMERIEFTIQSFEKAKVDALERKVNSMFELVKFKLFETQINGQEVPTCIATYDGVPYSDMNTAMKLNGGIDIINTISSHKFISAPIFVDHAESIIKLHHTESQIIRLIVSENHENLTVS